MKYFFPRPSEKDPTGVASIAAVRAYAAAIEKSDPELAHDLKIWMKKIQGTLLTRGPKEIEIYVKDIVRSEDIKTGDLYLRWKQSVDMKNWEQKTVILSQEEILERDFAKLPKQVLNLIKI